MQDQTKTKSQLIDELNSLRARVQDLDTAQVAQKAVYRDLYEEREWHTTAHPILSITELRPGDHLCCLYKNEEEHRAMLKSFLRKVLNQDEKVLYIIDASTSDIIYGYLKDDSVSVEPYLSSGQLSINTSQDAYMQEGVFDPDRMIAILRRETERALSEGYSALCVTIEMSWTLQGLPGSERLIEYEAKLNEFFPGSRCLAICQYDQRRFSPEILLDVLHTHPFVVSDTELYNNFYYIPPTVFLEGDIAATELYNHLLTLSVYKNEEANLRLYREIMTNMAGGVYLVRADDGIIVYANPRFEAMFGYARGELVGKHVSIVNAPAEKRPQKIALDIMHSLDSQSHWRGEIQNIKKDGTPFWCYLSVSVFDHLEYGKVFVSVHRDLTLRRKAEERLKTQNLQLEEKNIALREIMVQIEKERDRLGNQVIANVNKLIKPQLKKLKYSPHGNQNDLLTLIEHNLDAITSSFGFKLSSQLHSLSPREIEVCNLIREGISSKEIARLLHISEGTVVGHRNNIRRKLGIRKTKTNLCTYLNDL